MLLHTWIFIIPGAIATFALIYIFISLKGLYHKTAYVTNLRNGHVTLKFSNGRVKTYYASSYGEVFQAGINTKQKIIVEFNRNEIIGAYVPKE